MAEPSEDLVPFWLTRDEDVNGVLSETVDVWLERPTRTTLPGGGCMWIGSGVTGLEKRWAQWSLDNARKHATLPETSRECVRKY